MDPYIDHFILQNGGGGGSVVYGNIGSGVGRVYVGSPYQRGHGGIGSFLAGVFRRVLPLFKRGAKTIGKEAVRAGLNVMSDVTEGNTPFRESLRNRVRESSSVLKRKAEEKLDKIMEGSGYKVARFGDSLQLRLRNSSEKSPRRRKAITKKKKKKKKGGVTKRKSTTKKKKTKKVKKRTARDIFES